MADDILLSRLRNSVCWYNFQGTCFACEAADEIERLRSVNEALLQANADLRNGLRRSGQTILDLATLCHRLLDEQANELRQGDQHSTLPHSTDSDEQ